MSIASQICNQTLIQGSEISSQIVQLVFCKIRDGVWNPVGGAIAAFFDETIK